MTTTTTEQQPTDWRASSSEKARDMGAYFREKKALEAA